VLQMLQQILDAGNFRVRLVNPYQQKTKGEMLLEAKKPRTPLKTFMKEPGGVNACADLYARYFGRARRGSVR
jgi:hypothetical protein